MTYAEAATIVFGCALGAAFACMLVARSSTADQRRRRNELVSPMVQLVGLMFSVLLAFVFSEVWGEYNIAAQAISEECGAMHGAAMLAAALPDGRGAPLEQAISNYVSVVTDEEWPAMAHRQLSPHAVDAMRVVIQQSARLTFQAPQGSGAAEGQILALLTQAHAARETRAFQLTQGLPAPMWVVLDTIAVALIASVVLSGMEGLSHMAFAAAFAGCIIVALVLVSMFDYPFEGAMALGDSDFITLAGEVKSLLAG